MFVYPIVRGTCFQGSADRCSTIKNLLIEGFGASPTVKGEFESQTIPLSFGKAVIKGVYILKATATDGTVRQVSVLKE